LEIIKDIVCANKVQQGATATAVFHNLKLKTMTKTRDNSLTMNYSGKYGNQFVYRVRDDVSILAKKPRKTKKPSTASQVAVREAFAEAAHWAKKALQDPELLALYSSRAKGMKTAYVLAVTNYFKPPKVKTIDASAYSGAVGTQISVKAWDSFEVKGVTVKISDSTGNLIEEGACQLDSEGELWVYTATVAESNRTGLNIFAVAKNIPKHTGSLSLIL
jgi:hypothetical protein